ncbi:MAG TPA: putative O-glycosylation ligase, exosortase A system-associated [Rhizomicrobium sp.]|nr:putative O-glycosylation ligase, exosortase A system-associated [Rhizomicrobium sp.]
MREIIILLAFLVITVQAIRAPHAGILGWTWISLMSPQKMAWGFIYDFQFNLLLAIITLVGLLFSRNRKLPHWNALMFVWVLFAIDITITSVFSLAPEMSWERWQRALKTMALGFCVPMIMTSKDRIHALVLVIAISLGFFGVKGGVFTLFTGGAWHVKGADESGLTDNNYLALALCLTLPLLNYVRLQSLARITRVAAAAAMVLAGIAVLGTYSRGGLIGLAIMGGYLLWTSKRRIPLAILALVAGVAALQFMPQQWLGRMETIKTAQQDSSFDDRLEAWAVARNIAAARPLAGSGLGASERSDVFTRFRPQGAGATEPNLSALAYHSIYFQVLGDNGYPGLLLFLALLALTWRCLSQVRKMARDVPDQAWAYDLATMIQVSMVSYMVAGAALSMAYYDLPYLFMGIAVAMREIVLQAERSPKALLEAEPGFRRPGLAM